MAGSILDTPVNRTAAPNFTPTVGASHAIIIAIRRNSSGTVSPVTGVTLGGQAMTLAAGYSSGTYQRSAAGMWAINASQIAAMSGNTIATTGGSGTLLVLSLSIQGLRADLPAAGDFGQIDPADSVAATLARSITTNRYAGGLTLAVQHWNLVGTAVTMSNPARDFDASDAGSTVSISYEPDAANASVAAAWTNANTTTFASFMAASFREPSSQAITSVNGGAGVKIGSTGNTAITTGFTNITAGALGGKPLTITGFDSGTGVVNFNAPVVIDQESFPDFDSAQTIVLNNGSEEASLASIPISPPAGSTLIPVSSPENTDQRALGYWINQVYGFLPVTGDEYYGVDAQVTWQPDLYGSAAVLPVTTPVTYRRESTGIAYVMQVTINPEGDIVSVVGLTSIGLSSAGLSSSGLTSVGL